MDETTLREAARRMLERGIDKEKVREFVQRARQREQANASDQKAATELSPALKAATFVERAANSASMGLGGLAGDAIAAGIDPNKSFADVRSERSDRNKQLGAAGIAADIGGGLLTGGMSVNALKSIPRLANAGWKLAAGEAATQGAITGAAEGLNDTSLEGLANAGKNAAVGAAAGTVLGGAVGKVAGKVASGLKGRSLTKDLVARGVNVKEASTLANQLAEATPADVQKALDRVDEFAKAGRAGDVMAADVLGEEGAGLLRSAVNVSPKARGVAKERIRERDAGIGQRKVNDLEAATGTNVDDPAQSVNRMIEDRSQAAAPLYDAFRSLGELPITPELEQLSKLRIIRQAISTVKGESPDLAQLPWNDARVLDAVYKRVGSRAFKAQHGFEPGQARASLLDAIDAASGGKYRPAVESFADKSGAIDSYNTGLDMVNARSAGEAELAMQEAADPALLRRGHLDAMAGKIDAKAPEPMLGEAGTAANGLATEGTKTVAQGKQMRAIHGQNAFDTMVDRGKKEAAFARTSNATQGNSTSAQQIAGTNDLMGTVSDIASGFSLNPAWWATMTGRRLAGDKMNFISNLLAKGKANTVADALTKKGDKEARSVLEGLLAEMNRKEAAKLAGQKVARVTRNAVARAAAPNQ